MCSFTKASQETVCNTDGMTSSSEVTLESVRDSILKIQAATPRLPQRIILVESMLRALRERAAVDPSTPKSIGDSFSFSGIPIEAYPTEEEASARAEELAGQGVHVMLCISNESPQIGLADYGLGESATFPIKFGPY